MDALTATKARVLILDIKTIPALHITNHPRQKFKLALSVSTQCRNTISNNQTTRTLSFAPSTFDPLFVKPTQQLQFTGDEIVRYRRAKRRGRRFVAPSLKLSENGKYPRLPFVRHRRNETPNGLFSLIRFPMSLNGSPGKPQNATAWPIETVISGTS